MIGHDAQRLRSRSVGTDSAEKIKSAAEKLNEIINTDLDKRLADAKKAEKDGYKWKAFKAFRQLFEQFKYFKQGKQAKTAGLKLAKDKQVKRELVAANALVQIRRLLGSSNKRARQQAQAGIQTLIKQYGDTEAGQAASKLNQPQP